MYAFIVALSGIVVLSGFDLEHEGQHMKRALPWTVDCRLSGQLSRKTGEPRKEKVSRKALLPRPPREEKKE